MKKTLLVVVLMSIFGIYCTKTHKDTGKQTTVTYRQSFTAEEQKIIQVARQIVDSTYYGTLISIDAKGQAKARIMEPFPPNKHFEIYLATNPHSRKVSEIRQNNRVTLHYFDKQRLAYASFYGKAFIVQDDSLKNTFWKAGWERFYKNRKEDYMLIKFVPEYLEVISITDGLTGNKENWAPSHVDLVEK